MTRNGKRYFIDDCSNFSYVYLLKNKSEAIDMFKIFLSRILNQFNRKVKRIRSDRGKEYSSEKFPFKLRNSGGLASSSEPRSNESDKCIYYKSENDVCTVICL